jgi:hypothetical protein
MLRHFSKKIQKIQKFNKKKRLVEFLNFLNFYFQSYTQITYDSTVINNALSNYELTTLPQTQY